MARSVDLHEVVANASEAIIPIANTAVQMSALAEDPDVGAAQVGAIAMEDPAITAALLREANSAEQASRSPIPTVGRCAELTAAATLAPQGFLLRINSVALSPFVQRGTTSCAFRFGATAV